MKDADGTELPIIPVEHLPELDASTPVIGAILEGMCVSSPAVPIGFE